jgi:hypothetical protein
VRSRRAGWGTGTLGAGQAACGRMSLIGEALTRGFASRDFALGRRVVVIYGDEGDVRFAWVVPTFVGV